MHPVRPDCRGFSDTGYRVERSFNIVRKNIQSFRRDDHLLLAAANEQPALRVFLTDVTGVQPPLRVGGTSACRVVVVARRYVLAADEDLAIVGDLDLHAADGAAN